MFGVSKREWWRQKKGGEEENYSVGWFSLWLTESLLSLGSLKYILLCKFNKKCIQWQLCLPPFDDSWNCDIALLLNRFTACTATALFGCAFLQNFAFFPTFYILPNLIWSEGSSISSPSDNNISCLTSFCCSQSEFISCWW